MDLCDQLLVVIAFNAGDRTPRFPFNWNLGVAQRWFGHFEATENISDLARNPRTL